MAVVEDLRGPTCVALERWIAFHRQALGFMPGWETLRAEAVRSCAGTPAMLRLKKAVVLFGELVRATHARASNLGPTARPLASNRHDAPHPHRPLGGIKRPRLT
jgi:hypothetical protein